MRRLWCAVFLTYLALGATLQELPGYVGARFHGGPTAVGVAVGAAYAGTALTRPPAGWAGDAGLAQRVSFGGAALAALGAAGQWSAPDLPVLVACRFLMGVGGAAVFSGSLPWVLGGAATGHRGRVTGWFGLSMWAGMSLGPLLADAVVPAGGAAPLRYLTVALPAGAAVLIAVVRPQPAGSRSPDAGRPGGWRELVPRGVTLPGLCLGLSSYGYGMLVSLLVLYLSREHIGGEEMGLTVFSLTFLVTRAVGSPLVDRLGGVRVARVVLVIEALGLLALGSSRSALPALASTAVTGVGLGLIYPSVSAITLQRTGSRQAGVSMGAMTSFWDLGVVVAGPVGGATAGWLGYGPAFAVAAAVSLAAAGLTWAMAGGLMSRQFSTGGGEMSVAGEGWRSSR
ncbi:putative MFS family arabinose efflux permease [Kitasatospora viridis]|uniref:Putative MFS family arabinose efflux permease n=1 Tax=Kitasatospora viridis TaxID=281105 RepID=A0A561UCQ7_9ACTN|nr:putative MFS family arabinose efflux permease [Kitasatospora viridis]